MVNEVQLGNENMQLGDDFMFVTVDNLSTKIKEPVTKINIYREQLLRYLDDYQINLNDNANIISEKSKQ